MGEFDLIEKYFTWDQPPGNVITGVGDDAAVLELQSDTQLVTAVDTMVAGVHFPLDSPAKSIGHKSLAVNLSDLAAMGANPEWFTLALTLPEINHQWLKEFSSGLKEIAQNSGIYLVGGDTTQGPLTISIQVMGTVKKGKALLRSGAQLGDNIYVTGTLGDAAAGLMSIDGKLELPAVDADYCKQRLDQPQPRLAESLVISRFASSCIDVSDGLLQDLLHILKQSNKGAELDLSLIPMSDVLNKIESEQALGFALSGGDDYELLFTIPQQLEARFLQEMQHVDYPVSAIGIITDKSQAIVDSDGNILASKGYDHFHE